MNIHVHPERESKTAILFLLGAIPNKELIASVRGRSRWLIQAGSSKNFREFIFIFFFSSLFQLHPTSLHHALSFSRASSSFSHNREGWNKFSP